MDDHQAGKAPGNQPRILVADDMEVNQKIAQLILHKAGYRVDIAENGRQAVDAYQQKRHDLILMDIQMPLMDGQAATRRIRKWEKMLRTDEELKVQDARFNQEQFDEMSAFSFKPLAAAQPVPIIAMSGNATAGGFVESRYPGMNDCIGKPLQPDTLLAVVDKWLHAETGTLLIGISADEALAAQQRAEADRFPLDLKRAVQEFMGRKDVLIGVLQAFVECSGFKIETILKAVKSVDYGVIGSEAHAIKGAAANLTADTLARLAADLEQAAAMQRPDLTCELADKLEREFNSLKTYVRKNPELSFSI